MDRSGPIFGLIWQLATLTAVAATAGLGLSGLFAGVVFGLVVCLALSHGLGGRPLGPADRVTLGRAVLVGLVTALVVDPGAARPPMVLLVGVTAVALALDGVDGWVARRTNTCSALGARFDMEVDAFLILVLSVQVARELGPWVLAIGAMRYAYVAAGFVAPWLRGSLPVRYWRKVVAAAQGVILMVAMSGWLPLPAVGAVVLLALGLLLESFGRDVLWLWHNRTPAGLPVLQVVTRGATQGAVK
jgi:phosphatidylglycerophosphate synthase